MDPIFLTVSEVAEIHSDQIERYGGDHGIRELGLLHSAVAMPMATFAGQLLHHNLFGMAAAYLFHIVRNHPFIDGNKRTGAVSALVFLDMNGVEILAEEDDFEALVTGVAAGAIEKEQIAAFLETNSCETTS